ncbi:MAG: hypothetical protein U1E83_07905 [Methylotetracoccus sp.]
MAKSALGRAALLLIVILVAGGYTGSATAQTRAIITIDVESNDRFTLPEQVVAACPGAPDCGLMGIVRMLQQHGMSGTFFLNVYEQIKWGESALRGITAQLQGGGQDLALHTHPQWMYDPQRPGMNQYSLDEQSAIISEGVRLLRAWTGQPVVAHRAGDYAANEDTLEALRRSGIVVDSSYFWGHPHCQLDGLGLPRNLPVMLGSLVEIPVTIYQRAESPGSGGTLVEPARRVRKIDVDWFDGVDEAVAAVDAVKDADLPYLVVFLHSFSFLSHRGGDGSPVADAQAQANFAAILDHLQRRSIPVVTARELAAERAEAAPAPRDDTIPDVQVSVGWPKYLWHRLKATSPVLLLMLGGGAAIAVVLLFRRVSSRAPSVR